MAALMDKPSGRRDEARWLEVHDAALLLEAARIVQQEEERNRQRRANGERVPVKDHGGLRVELPIHAIIATFLLTGGRSSEVLGLAVTDVSFNRGTVTFRPNEHRRLKTLKSARVVPLMPQLRAILRDYLFGREDADVALLFPAPRTGRMIKDVRRALDRVAMRAGWAPGEIRTKAFRHTYCAARLQTLDRGEPVSPFTVAREMGHGGMSMVNRVYGHLGEVRHRAEVVEYSVEQHRDALGDRLDRLTEAAG